MEALSNVDNKTLETRWAEWDAACVKTGKGTIALPIWFRSS